MTLPFIKMHGCGNDFVVVRDADAEAHVGGGDVPGFVRRVCDRHFGLGADGLLAYGVRSAAGGGARLRMRYWNADGSRAEMCGNGARCVVRAAFDAGETASPLVLETDAGPVPARVADGGGVELDMGAPAWAPARVPVKSPAPVVDAPWRLGGGELRVTALSMGNPHAVVFLADAEALAALDLEALGRELSEHAAFPRGANASFAAARGGALHLRVWERGVGPTLACGTAACASVAAAARLGALVAPRARVHLPGGAVDVWQDAAGHMWLAGPAAYVARGEIADELLS